MTIKKFTIPVAGVLLGILLSFSAQAQESEGGTPPSFSIKGLTESAMPAMATGEIPLKQLQAEDEVHDKGKFPFRFGYGFDLNLNLKQVGLRQTLTDGSTIWRYTIQCPGAISVNLLYSKFNIPEGAKLYLYSGDKSQVLGAFTQRNVTASGQFATALIHGSTVTLEYVEPKKAAFSGEIVIGKVVHGYRDHSSFKDDVQKASGSCEININCPQGAGWENQKRSVARILIDGMYLCTGTMINNTANDDKPYFLTANHCTNNKDAVNNSDASGWIFYWNYESASCTGTTGPENQTTSGAVLKANSDASDFALMQLNNAPPASYNVYYSGWNRTNTPPAGAVCIHHPAGDIKKFSRDNSTLQTDGNYWKVPSWDQGVTEGGSSGSGLFDMNKRLVGQLLGGASFCGGSDLSDVYGKIWFSWDQAGTIPQRRLKDWLDPSNTGASTIDGKNPGGVTNQAPTVTITSPSDGAGFAAPASITIAATASDGDGTVSKVAFYNGTNLLGEDATAPYTFSWANIPAGNYSITARATDNSNLVGTSPPVNIIVANLRTPENPASTASGLNYSYYEGNWSTLPNFAALTAVKTGTVANVDLTPRNRDDQFGFSFTGFVNVATDGVYTFYTESDDGSRLYIGTTLVVDNDGSHGATEKSGQIGLKAGKHAITVNYFEGAADHTLIVRYASSSLAKQPIPASAFFRAVTVSNQPPTIILTAPLNNASYNAPATIAMAATAADADGTISKVEFYNGTVKIGDDASAPYTFSWANVAAGTYVITAKATDNLNATTTSTAVTVTVKSVSNTVGTFYQHCNYDVTGYAVALPLGDYTTAQMVAAGIRDNDISSLQISSGFQVTLFDGNNFTGTSIVIKANTSCLVANSFNDRVSSMRIAVATANQLPTATITSPASGATFTAPATINIAATASDPDGSIGKVEFYNGSNRLGEDLTTPYTYSWTGVAAGTYSITVRATDNATGVTTSSAVSVTVNPVVTNMPPTIVITSPASGTSYVAPASITFSANATDADGVVSNVQFFNGTSSIGSDATAPYSISWTNVAAGTYTITARATDNASASTTSAAITITVTNPTNDGCASIAQYIENGGYVAASKVKNAGRQYECKEWPYSGWCNGAAWAYAPGTGLYWEDAWYDKGSCTARIGSSDLNEAAEKLLTLAPNPTQHSITLEFNEIETSVNVIFLDAFGNSVKEISGLNSGSLIDVSTLSSGIYTLRIIGANGVYSRKMVKN